MIKKCVICGKKFETNKHAPFRIYCDVNCKVRSYRTSNLMRINIRRRELYGLNRDKEIERVMRYYEKLGKEGRKEKRKKYSWKWNYNYKHNINGFRDKVNAQMLVRSLVDKGVIIKEKNCVVCGSDKRINGHHEDYSKPTEVIW